jgi:hypothetical protein
VLLVSALETAIRAADGLHIAKSALTVDEVLARLNRDIKKVHNPRSALGA